jgi:dCTP deaminase
MFLSDVEIIEAINNKRIKIYPRISIKNIRPVGIRIRLSKIVFEPKEGITINASENIIDLNKYFIKHEIDVSYKLKPGNFILAYSYERLKTANDIIMILDGRSTLARMGITIHQSAFVLDNTHSDARYIMLELKNSGRFDVLLKAKIPIGMILFSNLNKPIKQTAQEQYSKQNLDDIGGSEPYQLRLFYDID